MSVPHLSAADDELNSELEAMQTIARALIRLRDPHVRLRVLRWTNDRFTAAPSAIVATPNAQADLGSDPSLTLDARELFPDRADEVPPAGVAAASLAAEPPLDLLMRGFATDFRTLALRVAAGVE